MNATASFSVENVTEWTTVVNVTEWTTIVNETWFTDMNVTDGWSMSNFTTLPPSTIKPYNNYHKYKKRCGHDYQFAMRGVILGVIIGFGIIGNVLSALVMRHDVKTSATSLLFFALAMVDMSVLISRLFFVCVPQWLIYFRITGREYRRFQYNYVDAYGQAFAYTSQHWTAGMTVLVTVHRYMVVCKPTKASKFASVKAVLIQIAVVLLCITVYNIPLYFEWKVSEVYSWRRGTYSYKKRQTPMAISPSYIYFYRIAMLYLMLYVIPVLFLVVLSYQLVLTVKRASEKLKKMSNRGREKHDMTKTLVAIIICYVICQLPTPTDILIRELTDRRNRRCPYFFYYFTELVDVGICFNSAFNFVLYCLFGKRFRRQLKSLIFGHKMRIEPMEPTLEGTDTTQVASTTGSTNMQPISKPGLEI